MSVHSVGQEGQLTKEDFLVLLKRAGLALPVEDVDRVYAAWPLLAPLLERIRGNDRGRDVYPAQVFRAEAYIQGRVG